MMPGSSASRSMCRSGSGVVGRDQPDAQETLCGDIGDAKLV